ncbi:hypothetical protein ACA29_06255 [Lederbergia galactosidilytica]|uniref:Gram-positive cocci surface proteins LPxTG domain-containing protein n=1 Tax=Lederbergia galactosidilytica TaxID=217031 RepID=A0A0Q9YAT4_9BACI|nr:hypothetical protein ACA29_06255 [Lederbergia galactosidilytica]
MKADKREEHGITSSLPNTATNTFNLLFIGLMLVVIGGIAFIIFNRRKVKNELSIQKSSQAEECLGMFL